MEQDQTKQAAKENALMIGTLLLILLLFGALIASPFVLARFFGIWVGLLSALAAIPAWVYLGPRPMPGFTNGIIFLLGLAVLLGALVAWIIRLIRYVSA